MLRNLKEEFEQFTSSIGLVSGSEFGTKADNINDVMREKLEYPTDLATLFCYRSFDSENGLFYNNDDNTGFILEIAPIVGVNDAVLKNLQHFLDDELPEHSYVQFLLIASHKVGNILTEWSNDRSNSHPALTKLTKKRVEFVSELALDFSKSADRVARDIRIIISCNWHGNSTEKILAFKQQFTKKLETLQLYPQILGAQNLLDLTDEILHFRLDVNQRGSRYNPLMLLCDQVTAVGSSCKLEESQLEFSGNVISKCYRVAEFPKGPKSWGLVKMIELLGSSSRASLNIPARFLISYSVASDINKGKTSALISKGEAAIKSAEQWYARYDTNLRKEAEEWVDIVARLKQGQRVLSESFQVMITAKKNMIDEAEASLLSLYNVNDWKLILSKNLQLPSLLSMMPMQASSLWSALKLFKMKRLGLSEELVAKLPIHAEWRGVPETCMLLFARRGQLFNFNPFYRIADGNYNVCVFGPSGSGKSVFLQEFATSMLAQGAKVFILDIGGSYKNICHLLDGDFIQFKADANISLNPFGSLAGSGQLQNEILEDGSSVGKMIIGKYLVATEAIIYAKSILGSMCGVSGNQFKESLLEETITKAVEIFGPNLNISKIANILINEGSLEAKQMGQTLYPYTAKGIYGKYFETDSNITFKKQFTVFEFEEIKNDIGLLSVVLQTIAMQIFLQILCGDRKQKFVLIVDEAWKIVDSAAKFLAEPARTFRKYGASLVTCVQNYSDLQLTEDHQTILKNSTWSVILKQNEQGLNSFKGTNYEEIIPLIKSVSIVPGKYAEALLYSTGIRVVGKLVLDPYSQVLFSTDSSDFDFIKILQSRGISLDQAVEKLIEKKNEKRR
ncbi:MAG: TraC family protein [Rickettsiaceae bacterium]|nr:TraC family protein [Rickettsiaceae bacterium]